MPAKRDPYVQVDVGLESSRVVRELSDTLAVELGGTAVPVWLLRRAVVGLLTATWGQLLTARPDGDVREIDDEDLERFAGWRGTEGAWARAFRAHCVTDAGLVDGWERYDALEKKRSTERERQRRLREERLEREGKRSRDVTPTPSRKSAGAPRNGEVGVTSPPVTPTLAVTSHPPLAVCHGSEERRETAVLPPCFAEGGSTDSLDPEAVQERAPASPAAGGAGAPPPTTPSESQDDDGRAAFRGQLRLIRLASPHAFTGPHAERLTRLVDLDRPVEHRHDEIAKGLVMAAERLSPDRTVLLRSALQTVADAGLLSRMLDLCEAWLEGCEKGGSAFGAPTFSHHLARCVIALCQATQLRSSSSDGTVDAFKTALRVSELPTLRPSTRRVSLPSLEDSVMPDRPIERREVALP